MKKPTSPFAPTTISGAPIMGIAHQRLKALATQHRYPAEHCMWMRPREIKLLSLEPLTPSVIIAGVRYYSPIHLLNGPTKVYPNICAEQRLPINRHGTLFGGPELFAEAQSKMCQHEMDNPVWLTANQVQQLGGEVLTTDRQVEATQNDAPVAFVNAMDTSLSDVITAETAVGYNPVLFPAAKSHRFVSLRHERLLLTEALARGFVSELWVRTDHAAGLGLMLRNKRPATDEDEEELPPMDLGEFGKFYNGECFVEQDRVQFFETYVPVGVNGKPLPNRANFAAVALDNGIKNPLWVTASRARTAGLTFTQSGVAVEVPFDGKVVAYVNPEQSSNPKAFAMKWSSRATWLQ